MRFLWPLGLLVIVGAAMAAPSSQHGTLEQTTCYDCHGPTLWDPAMTGPVVELLRFQEEGDHTMIHLDVRNDWLHDVTIGAFARSNGELSIVRQDVATPADVTGRIPASIDQSTVMMAFDMPDVPAIHLGFSAIAATDVDARLEIRPAGSQREWTPITTTSFGVADIAAAGWGDWEGRITVAGPHGETDWTLTFEVPEFTGEGGLAFSDTIAPGQTGSLSWMATNMGRTTTERFVVDLYSTFTYTHDEGVDDDEGYAYSMADFAITLDEGRPSSVDNLRDPSDESVPGAALPLLGVGLLLAGRRRRA